MGNNLGGSISNLAIQFEDGKVIDEEDQDNYCEIPVTKAERERGLGCPIKIIG